MNATLTKAQFQSALADIPASSIVLYTKLAGVIVKIGIGWYGIGWIDLTISGTYTEEDFLDDTAGFSVRLVTTL